MIEGGVDHAIRVVCSAAQAFEVLDIASMHLGAGSGERRGGRIRTNKPEHLMARGDQFFDDGRADKSGGTGNEDAHEEILRV